MGVNDLECGDLSPLFLLWRLVAKAEPRSAARGKQSDTPPAFDGDKSPAKSADKSAHSKAGDCAFPALRFGCRLVRNRATPSC